MSPRRGFSFIELMISIAIVGILAALAVPRFTAMQLRTKRAEVNANTAGAFDALRLYAEVDSDVATTLNTGWAPDPAPSGSKDLRNFFDGVSASNQQAWKLLGWEPDGQVRCSYSAYAAGGAQSTYYYVQGQCDLDADGSPVLFYHYGPAFEALLPASQYPQADLFPTRF